MLTKSGKLEDHSAIDSYLKGSPMAGILIDQQNKGDVRHLREHIVRSVSQTEAQALRGHLGHVEPLNGARCCHHDAPIGKIYVNSHERIVCSARAKNIKCTKLGGRQIHHVNAQDRNIWEKIRIGSLGVGSCQRLGGGVRTPNDGEGVGT